MTRNLTLLSALILIILSSSAMALTNFWYNGYAIDAYGQILPSTTIDVRMTITNSGGVQFQETHSAIVTDQFGSFVVEVGAGTWVSGNLGSIVTTAETKIKSEARVGAGPWVISTNASLSMVNINTIIMPGFIELPQNYIIMGDAYNNGEAVQVGGDLTGTNNAGVADLQINPSTVGSTEIIDNSIVNADVNTAAAIQVTKLQAGGANQFLVNNGTNAWAAFNHDATLLGNGVGTALGFDLAHPNSWSALQTFATVDINGGSIDNTIIGAAAPAAGTFTALTANGLTTLNDDVILGLNNADHITFNGYVINSIIPNANNTYDLGTTGLRWHDIYFGGTLDGQDAKFVNLTVTGTTILGDAITDPIILNGTVTSNLGPVLINDAITQSGSGAVSLSGPTTIANTITQTGGGQVTFSGNVNANSGVDVTGADLTVTGVNLNMNENNIINANIIDGGTSLSINTTNNGTITTGTGLITLNGNVDATNGVDVTGANLTVGGAGNFFVSPVGGMMNNGTSDLRNTIYNTNFGATPPLWFGDALIPVNDNVYDLGSATLRWKDIYSGGTIYGNNAQLVNLTVSGSTTLGDATTDPIYLNGTISSTVGPVLINDAITQSGGGAVGLSGPTTIANTITQTGGGQVTFSGNVNANSGVDVTGADLTVTGVNLNMNENNIINANIMDGGAALSINTTNNGTITTGTGQITLNGNVDATNGVDVTGANLTVTGVNLNMNENNIINANIIDGGTALSLNTTNNGTITTGTGQITLNGNVDATNGIDVTGNATVTGNIDVNGYIMNSTASNNQAVYINDYLQISNTISNPTLQNNGRVFVGDDFEVSGSVYLGGANTDNVYFVADVNSNIIPNTDITFDLGTTSQRWRDIYSGGTIYGNNAQLVNLTVTGTTTLGDAVADPVYLNGTISSTLGPVIINDAISQTGGEAVNFSGATTISNTFTQSGGGQVTISGNIDAASGIDIGGLTTHNGDITQSSGTAQFLNTTVNGTFTQTTGNVTIGGATQINNNLRVNGTLTVGSLGQFNGGLQVTSGSVTLDNGVDATFGASIAHPTSNTDLAIAGNLEVTGNTYLNGTLNVTGAALMVNATISGALNDGASNGNTGQVPIASGAGNWAWQDVAGSFAIATDGITIVGNGTTGNPIRTNDSVITSNVATFNAGTIASVFNYTGGTDDLVITNATTGRRIWVIHSAGGGILRVAPSSQLAVGTAKAYIYSGTAWIEL